MQCNWIILNDIASGAVAEADDSDVLLEQNRDDAENQEFRAQSFAVEEDDEREEDDHDC